MADLGLKRLPHYLKYKLECLWFATFCTFSYIDYIHVYPRTLSTYINVLNLQFADGPLDGAAYGAGPEYGAGYGRAATAAERKSY